MGVEGLARAVLRASEADVEQNRGGAGDDVAVAIPGADSAQFYEGEAPGMAFLVWETGEAECGEIGLQLVASEMTRAQAREEIVKVAKSLAT